MIENNMQNHKHHLLKKEFTGNFPKSPSGNVQKKPPYNENFILSNLPVAP